jgi:hypothetical protein
MQDSGSTIRAMVIETVAKSASGKNGMILIDWAERGFLIFRHEAFDRIKSRHAKSPQLVSSSDQDN